MEYVPQPIQYTDRDEQPPWHPAFGPLPIVHNPFHRNPCSTDRHHHTKFYHNSSPVPDRMDVRCLGNRSTPLQSTARCGSPSHRLRIRNVLQWEHSDEVPLHSDHCFLRDVVSKSKGDFSALLFAYHQPKSPLGIVHRSPEAWLSI